MGKYRRGNRRGDPRRRISPEFPRTDKNNPWPVAPLQEARQIFLQADVTTERNPSAQGGSAHCFLTALREKAPQTIHPQKA